MHFFTPMQKINYLLIILVFITIILIPQVQGARVYGSIYDLNMNTINSVVVEVNSTPRQRHVSRYGGYSFELEPGKYLIQATITQNSKTIEIAAEVVEVLNFEGEYIVDLFIYPDIVLSNDQNGVTVVRNNYITYILAFVLIMALIGLITTSYFLYRKKKKKNISVEYNIQYPREEVDEKVKNIEIKVKSEDDAIKKRILNLIKENNNELSQKEIRKKIQLSESKISQVISVLTKEKQIEKIKKGRKNILIIK